MTNELMNEGYCASGQWAKAEKECRKALKKEPESHWWLIHLALALVEQGKLKQALNALWKAHDIQPHCPLVQWYLGVVYYEYKQWASALHTFQHLHNRCIKKLNSDDVIDDCWESIKRTEEIDNDCRGRIGFCHLHLDHKKKAVWWLKQHLQNRKKGRFSIYDAKVVRQYIKDLESE